MGAVEPRPAIKAPRAVQHTNRGLVEQGAYATKQLRQRRTYGFYPWNPVVATPEPKRPRPAPPRDPLKLARHYQSLMDSGKFESRAALARHLGVSRVRLMTNNPLKVDALQKHGIEVVERVPLMTGRNPHNDQYLDTKQEKML